MLNSSERQRIHPDDLAPDRAGRLGLHPEAQRVRHQHCQCHAARQERFSRHGSGWVPYPQLASHDEGQCVRAMMSVNAASRRFQ
jgi:hypothetical protein